jgi:hypothetical protein
LQVAYACPRRRSDGRIGARRENGIRDITLAFGGLYRFGNKKMTEGKKDYGKEGKTAELGWVFEAPQQYACAHHHGGVPDYGGE